VGPDLDVAVVRRETMVAVLPATLAVRFRDRVDLAELAGEEFFTPTGSGALAAHLTGACRHSGFEPMRREVQLVHTAVALVGASADVSVLPAAVREVCPPQAVVLPLARRSRPHCLRCATPTFSATRSTLRVTQRAATGAWHDWRDA
jgi:LysR substrate binding domain